MATIKSTAYHEKIREQRRYEIARDVMAAKHGAYWGVSNPEGAARDSVYAADALLAALEETER